MEKQNKTKVRGMMHGVTHILRDSKDAHVGRAHLVYFYEKISQVEVGLLNDWPSIYQSCHN